MLRIPEEKYTVCHGDTYRVYPTDISKKKIFFWERKRKKFYDIDRLSAIQRLRPIEYRTLFRFFFWSEVIVDTKKKNREGVHDARIVLRITLFQKKKSPQLPQPRRGLLQQGGGRVSDYFYVGLGYEKVFLFVLNVLLCSV